MVHAFKHEQKEHGMLETLCQTWGFWTYAELAQTLAHRKLRIFYTAKEERMTGIIIYEVLGDAADLIYLYTEGACRKLGLADALFRAMRDDLASSKVAECIAEVSEHNVPALSFYQKMGMKEISQRPRYYRNGDTALIYGLSAE